MEDHTAGPHKNREGPAHRYVTGISLLDPPEGVLTIKTYANVDFVNIVVKKPLYEQLEKEAKRLETKLDVLIYNALILMLEKLKRGKSAQTFEEARHRRKVSRG